MSEHVRIVSDGGICALTLARPERRNAITVEMYSALADAIDAANAEPAIRLITLASDGVDFTAGNELADFLSDRSLAEGETAPVWRLMRAMVASRLPSCLALG